MILEQFLGAEPKISSSGDSEVRFTISEFASLLALDENAIRARIQNGNPEPEFLSIKELAKRWRVSRATVYNRLRATGTPVLDFSTRGHRSRKVVRMSDVKRIEAAKTKKLC